MLELKLEEKSASCTHCDSCVFRTFLVWDRVSCIPGLLGTHYVSMMTLSWFSWMLGLQAVWIIGLGLNPGLHCLIGKDSTNRATPPAHSFLFMGSVLWDRRTLLADAERSRILPLPAFVLHREGEKSWNLVLGAVVLTHRVLLAS